MTDHDGAKKGEPDSDDEEDNDEPEAITPPATVTSQFMPNMATVVQNKISYPSKVHKR